MATRQRIYWILVLARHSPFLANSSTCQNGLFGKLVGLAKFVYIRQPGLLGLAKFVHIRQPVLLGLARLADIHQPVLLGLARLAGLGELLRQHSFQIIGAKIVPKTTGMAGMAVS